MDPTFQLHAKMHSSELKTRILLLVEDNPEDAELVTELLSGDRKAPSYQVYRARSLEEAKAVLTELEVDVVLLDIRLPDANGLEGLRAILSQSPDLPVVVLTGLEDQQLELSCIDAGAQDYINKNDLKPAMLRRSIGYAITRLREQQLRELQRTLSNYKHLGTKGRGTNVTATLAGSGPMRDRHRDKFAALTRDYVALFETYIRQLYYRKEKPLDVMARLSTRIGDMGGGPRDLIDLHVAALELAIQGLSIERTRFVVVEGRLLALEMMGLLVDFYRTGQRRTGRAEKVQE